MALIETKSFPISKQVWKTGDILLWNSRDPNKESFCVIFLEYYKEEGIFVGFKPSDNDYSDCWASDEFSKAPVGYGIVLGNI